ncbi:glycosyl hydrolase family 88 [Acidovorax delafieldii 2AN]|uniref:Glycosyl hydrolase family 88 n=1 Tax=Acidovorax delafieldii 2AN TaxID=573060 RepID=C5T098_ACIDE|nr:glycoside hydrolase family 88 protein [Acidovorax delafieldii]EER62051.1 glycosyl hydrolase family 88 [Acidovorax delafieldii 2AN]
MMAENQLAERVLQFAFLNGSERDCWTKAAVITAALRAGRNVEVADLWLSRAVATQRSDGNLGYADTVQGLTAGHVRSFTPLASLSSALGYPLLLSHQRSPNARFLSAATRQAEALMAAPRTSDGGVWARAEGPELWVDFTYLMSPFLALYGKITGRAFAVDEAFLQFEVHVAHLLDPRKKLVRHAWCEKPDHYPQSTFWTRGNGWLVCAGVDLLEIAPEHDRASFVRKTVVDVLNAMTPYQDASGYFCHVLDDTRSNLEASGSLMYAYAVAKAVRLGLLGSEELTCARRAVDVVAGAVEPSGKVPGVAVPPGGPGVPFDWTLFGQGFFVLAVDALHDVAEVGVPV